MADIADRSQDLSSLRRHWSVVEDSTMAVRLSDQEWMSKKEHNHIKHELEKTGLKTALIEDRHEKKSDAQWREARQRLAAQDAELARELLREQREEQRKAKEHRRKQEQAGQRHAELLREAEADGGEFGFGDDGDTLIVTADSPCVSHDADEALARRLQEQLATEGAHPEDEAFARRLQEEEMAAQKASKGRSKEEKMKIIAAQKEAMAAIERERADAALARKLSAS